jgi:hypothetical protein
MGHPLNTLGQTLIEQVRETVTGGDGKVPPSKNSFITWAAPGIPMPATAFDFAANGFGSGADAEAEKRLLNHAFNWAQLVDFVPDVTAAYTNGRQDGMFRPDADMRLSTIYGEILRGSRVVQSELTATEKAKLEKFRKLLRTTKTVKDIITDEEKEVTEDGPILKAYYAKQADYIAAALQYNAKRIAAQAATGVDGKAAIADWSSNAELYRLQVRSALGDWVAGGYRNEVDAINAYIDQVTRRDMALWKQALVELYEEAVVNGTAPGQRFFYTTLIPGDFATSGGWQGTGMDISSVEKSTRSESTSWSAKGGLNFGLFSTGGNAKSKSSKLSADTKLSSFKISMELCQTIICRPWAHMEFFRNRGWTLTKGSGWMYDDMPSDGDRPPKGNFIGFPTIALWARNVTIESKEFVSAYTAFKKEVGADASVGWGPFSLSGSYSHSAAGTNFEANAKGEKLTVNGMQCIGFINHLIGKAPDPLPGLTEADFSGTKPKGSK